MGVGFGVGLGGGGLAGRAKSTIRYIYRTLNQLHAPHCVNTYTSKSAIEWVLFIYVLGIYLRIGCIPPRWECTSA